MTTPEFLYTTYIKTTPQQVWDAITTPEFTRQYWGGDVNISDWKPGSTWRHADPESGETAFVVGEVLESQPPTRLVLSWVDADHAADKSRYSRVTIEIEPIEDMVRLNVTHSNADPEMLQKVSNGWPRVLSSMKSFLETGKPLDIWAGHTRTCSAKPVTAAKH